MLKNQNLERLKIAGRASVLPFNMLMRMQACGWGGLGPSFMAMFMRTSFLLSPTLLTSPQRARSPT